MTRITSYNVCYTKLLRLSPCMNDQVKKRISAAPAVASAMRRGSSTKVPIVIGQLSVPGWSVSVWRNSPRDCQGLALSAARKVSMLASTRNNFV